MYLASGCGLVPKLIDREVNKILTRFTSEPAVYFEPYYWFIYPPAGDRALRYAAAHA